MFVGGQADGIAGVKRKRLSFRQLNGLTVSGHAKARGNERVRSAVGIPKFLTVTADTLSRKYGDANPALTYTVGGAGLVNGDTLTGALATTATLTTGVGTAAITQGSLAASANHSASYVGAEAPLAMSCLRAVSELSDLGKSSRSVRI